jgi:hypothetical protein
MVNKEFSLLVNTYCTMYLCLQTARQQQVGGQPSCKCNFTISYCNCGHHLASIMNLRVYYIPLVLAVADPGIKTCGASQQKLWDQTIYATVKLH